MRRLASITALALFLAVPLWAQRGGGGHGGGFGGGHASFGGGHSAGFAGHGFSASGGVHSSAGFSRGPMRSYNRSFSRGPYLHNGYGNRFGRFRTHGFRNNCYGYRCGYGYGYGYPWWGYDPFWDWSADDAQFDSDYNNNIAEANEMNEESLEQQQMLRQEEADGDQDAYAPRRAPAPVAHSVTQQTAPVVPQTVLVYRDQHLQEVQNYAIVGNTLWNFTPQRTQKIPLTDLDLPATEKANDDRGVTFRVPTVNEAQ